MNTKHTNASSLRLNFINALFLLTAMCILGAGSLFSQPAEIWNKTYFNPNGTGYDYVDKSITDSQGNLYIACATRTASTSDDIMLLKYNSAGALQWTKIYNYSYNGIEQPNDICLDNSGNIYVTGTSTRGQFGVYDCILLKYDASGNILWVRRINKTNYTDRESEGVSLVYRDGIYVGINFDYNNWSESGIAKYSPSGDSIAYIQTGFIQNYTYRMWKMVSDNSLNIYAIYSASLLPNEGEDLVVKKISTNGNLSLVWSKTYTGPSHLNDRAKDVAVGPDGNVFVTGHTYVSNQGSNVILMKYGRDDGALLMQKTYNNDILNQDEFGYFLQFDNNFNIIVGGGAATQNNASNILFLKYSPTGSLIWKKEYSESAGTIDGLRGMKTDNFGNIYFAGDYSDQVQQIYGLVTGKVSESGEFDWVVEKNMNSIYQYMNSLSYNTDGTLVFTANIEEAGVRKILSVKYGSTIGISPISGNMPEKYSLGQNYPNPFNPVTNIKFSLPTAGNVKLSVFDLQGREVAVLADKNLAAGEYNADFDASGLSSGVYFYKLVTNEFTEVKKMMLIK